MASDPVRMKHASSITVPNKFSSFKRRRTILDKKLALNVEMKNKHSSIVHLVSVQVSKEQFFAANGNELESPLIDFAKSSSHES